MNHRKIRVACVVLIAAFVSACSVKRPTLTEPELQAQFARDMSNYEETFDATVHALVERVYRESQEHKAGRRPEPCLDVLALSGGGDKGAFGAGFLRGWGLVEDPVMRRPEFDVVTGVSTGALLAPFAFLGGDEDLAVVEHFYRNPQKDWVQLRDMLFFLPGRVSLLDITGLEKELDRVVDDEFVARLAADASTGRALVISATNLEFGCQRRWNLAEEAKLAGQTGEVDRIRKMMLASSALPGAFPPVALDDFLYSDGGITANILLPLDWRSETGFYPTWKRKHPDEPPPLMRYWVIVNNQLRQPPKTAQATWPFTASVGVSAAVRCSNVVHLELLRTQAEFLNATGGTRIEVRVVAIPDDWRAPVEGVFKEPTMNSLADLGRKLGADADSWTLYTSPSPTTSDARARTGPRRESS